MIMSMAFGVFLHKSDSPYKDELLEQYQFPKIYLKQHVRFGVIGSYTKEQEKMPLIKITLLLPKFLI